MEFNYFDIVVSVIVLFLGLKGILNGFFKELFGLIGIVGGIFIASRVGDDVGQKLSDMIFNFENSAAVNFTGFLATLALFWLLMVVAGIVFKKLSHMSGLGIFDKILGFFFGASKFFLIAAVITYAAYNVKAVRSSMDSMMNNSFMFPILVETGGFIMKLDPVDINETIDKGSKIVEGNITETVKTSAIEMIQETKDQVKSAIEQNSSIETK